MTKHHSKLGLKVVDERISIWHDPSASDPRLGVLIDGTDEPGPVTWIKNGTTPAGDVIGAELAYPLLATFLLKGGRLSEVLGLELDDVSFDRQTVTFRPNAWRRLKTQTS